MYRCENKIQYPFDYENRKSDKIVIFIHGILEGPNQFREFANILEKENIPYSAILLSGHGKTYKEFVKSSKEGWINSIDREILKYKDKYRKTILVGHSMGGLLSILSSLKYKDSIEGIVLISTPLKVFVRLNMITSIIKIGLHKEGKQDILPIRVKRMLSVSSGPLLSYLKYIPRYIDLFHLIKLTNKNIENISVPALIVQCKKDEVISYKSLEIFERKLKNDYEIIKLNKSDHFYYNYDDFEYLANKLILFIKKI